MSMSYRKLAYQAEARAQKAERTVGQLASRVAELERAIADHRSGVLELGTWDDEALWRVLPREMKAGRCK
jgi:hypothetical protein